MMTARMSRQRIHIPILLLLILFLLATTPFARENLHVTFIHRNEIAHRHSPDGAIHYHEPEEERSPADDGSRAHQHSFKEFSLIFTRIDLSCPQGSRDAFPPLTLTIASADELSVNPLLLQPLSYRGPPDAARFASQVLFLSHLILAPPLA